MNIHHHPTKKIGLVYDESVPRLKLASYRTPGRDIIAPPPERMDWQIRAPDAMEMFGNDEVGDCYCAATAHHFEVVNGCAGRNVRFTKDQVLGLYSQATGYDPRRGTGENNPTDRGTNPEQIFKVLQSDQGFLGHRAVAYAEIDFTNPDALREGIYYFGGMLMGFGLPLAWQDAKGVWAMPRDLSADEAQKWSWGGHAVNSPAYGAITDGLDPVAVRLATKDSLIITSWEQRIVVPFECVARYGLFAQVIITPDMINDTTHIAANGYDLAALTADFNALPRAA